MNSIENLEWRYAVKKFDDKKFLEDAQVNTLKQIFNAFSEIYSPKTSF